MVDPSGDCSRQAQVYIVTCSGCNETVHKGPQIKDCPKSMEVGGEGKPNYVGMTGTSLHARGVSHLQAIKSKNKSNALALHVQNVHAGVVQQFTMRLCTTHRTVMY